MQGINIKDNRSTGWFVVENDLIDLYGETIGAYGIAVYCVIAKYANPHGKNAYPSYQTIADKIGCSRRQVIRCIDQLVELGLIKKSKRFNENGDTTSNTYVLTNIPKPSDSQSPPSDSQSPPSDSQSPPSDSQSPPSDSQSPPLVTHSHPNNTQYEQYPMNKRDQSSSYDQAGGNAAAQPTTPPPSFPQTKDDEYLPGLPMPTKRTEQLFVDGLMSQVKSVGLDAKTFREMVDRVLAKHGKLDMVQADTEFGRKALSKAQEACLTIAKADPKFRSVAGIESVYQSWHDNDWRWETLPTMNQLIEHAGMMKAGQVTCQRKDKQQRPNNIAAPAGMVMHFAGDQP